MQLCSMLAAAIARSDVFLSDKGYDVVNFDVSPAVIEMMRKQRPDLKWVCADCAVEGSLGEPEACDYVLDKGRIDALLEAETENARSQARCMVKEVFRVLRRHQTGSGATRSLSAVFSCLLLF